MVRYQDIKDFDRSDFRELISIHHKTYLFDYIQPLLKICKDSETFMLQLLQESLFSKR